MIRLVLILAGLAILLGAAILLLSGSPQTAGPPEDATATSASPEMAAPDEAMDDSIDGPDNSFVVCPGDPRCP